jgi:hypothetical protein
MGMGREERFETVVAVLIALVTVATAVVVWRASLLSSEATGAERAGIIDTLKAQAATAENLAYLYQQEAELAQSHLLVQVQIDYLRGQAAEFEAQAGGTGVAAVLNAESDALTMVAQAMASTTPLISDARYRRADGTLDFQARLADLAAETPDLAALDPTVSFATADGLDDRSLYLGGTLVVFALALFGLTLAQITRRRIRWLFLTGGVVLTVVAIVAAAGVEFLVGRLG